MVYNHKDLQFQAQWAGPRLQTLKIMVCDSCLDRPQEQLRSFIIPPDPIPIDTPRPEQYSIEVDSYVSGLADTDELLATEGDSDIITQDGEDLTTELAGTEIDLQLTTEDEDNLILEIEDVLSPNPENPAIYP